VYNGLIKKYLREVDNADMEELYGKLDQVESMINALVEPPAEPEEEAYSPPFAADEALTPTSTILSGGLE
jgi:hypothetical protein